MHRISLVLLLVVGLTAGSLRGQLAESRWNVSEAAGGGVVAVPAGRYRIAGHLTIPANVTLQGVYRVPPTTGPRAITNLTGSAAVQLDAGKAIVQGCTFGEDNLHVQVGSNVLSALLTANQAAGGFRVENRAGKRLTSLNRGGPLKATLPASAEERVRLELRCRGWVPQATIAGSRDARTLGVQVYSVTVRAAQADERVFHANTGKWVTQK